jgi:hypothetical protein
VSVLLPQPLNRLQVPFARRGDATVVVLQAPLFAGPLLRGDRQELAAEILDVRMKKPPRVSAV